MADYVTSCILLSAPEQFSMHMQQVQKLSITFSPCILLSAPKQLSDAQVQR
jgi:hypothetical protein